jgi:CRP-like cAMP-binding protein
MKSVSFKAGDTILSEGADGNTAFLIVSGAVEVTIGSGRDAKTVGNLQTGEVFGEMSLIEPGPPPVDRGRNRQETRSDGGDLAALGLRAGGRALGPRPARPCAENDRQAAR